MNATKLDPHESTAMWVFSATLCLIILLTGITALIKQYSRKNIEGQWKMTFINERGIYKPDTDETHTHQILFTQNEEAILGAGENRENPENLFPHKMEYKGVLDDDVLKITYKLSGNEKETIGIIEATITGDGKNLMGTFTGTGDNTKGTVMGERLE